MQPNNDNTQSSLTRYLGSSLGVADARRVASNIPASQLFDLLFHDNPRVAGNAAWALTHKPTAEIATLPQPQLINLAITTPTTSLRRLVLNLINRQGIAPDDIRTDFLDFCLHHMLSLDEPTGVQTLCMKLAHSMCSHYPELQREFLETLALMHPENYNPGLRCLINKVKSF